MDLEKKQSDSKISSKIMNPKVWLGMQKTMKKKRYGFLQIVFLYSGTFAKEFLEPLATHKKIIL